MMNKKKIIRLLLCLTPLILSAMPEDDIKRRVDILQRKLNKIPDSVYTEVKKENLLEDDVYVKLARDGWSNEEIRIIMNDYIRKNRKSVRGSLEYGRYAKQWLPSYGYTPGGDTLYQFVDTTYNKTMIQSARMMAGRVFDEYYEPIPYSPDDRKLGKRNTGRFRPVLPKPSSGRIHWIHVHPENPDSIMVIPDGGGINRTHDGGKTWECITDRTPTREHRNTAVHSAIPVDPDDWNHVFAFMSNGNPVYETRDGGLNWRRINGATHKGFKRGYCFRDREGNLKFIGAVQSSGSNYWSSPLWISEDTCKTWTKVILPEELKDIRPENNVKGAWFQQVEFDPSNRDMIYLPTSRSIFYFDDGAKSYIENGRKVYKIKKMNLRVLSQDSLVLRSDTTVFPFKATTQSFLNINPNNPNQMWFATGSRNTSYGNHTAVYYTDNKGKSWRTLNETISGIGAGAVFGNETPWGWLGGFGVNYKNPQWVYGCSMSSAISSNGGKRFQEFSWANRLNSLQDDGLYYPVTNARHNADNHCIVSHKSGRVFRGSDAGILMKDENINNHQWTNIGGNMGQMLFYTVKVNEFGDQLILGNTQDIDAQTYRYGRWGHWRGYEGSNAFINPYGNTCHFSGSDGGGIEDIDMNSWNRGWSCADVCTGNWYLRREKDPTFYRLDDFGRSVINLTNNIGEKVKDFALARDNGHCTLFVYTNIHYIKKSVDNGNTFQNVARFPPLNAIAADPDNSNILYLARKGQVLKYFINEKRSEDLSYNLPNVDCNDLILHEGSGDLYFVHTGSGIYLKEHNSNEWKLWMKGYNPAKFGSAELNYTTQEMVIQDYGRGVYVADLQNPSDRYFKNGFELKELSHIDGRRTIGIDTNWTIPLYYHYKWTLNGTEIDTPYQYLTRSLSPGDRIQLTLTLRESPDVSTTSAEYIVKASASTNLQKHAGKALYSNGQGRVDLGYVDYFSNDFTIELWAKPQSNGVLLCNRQKNPDKGAKGWYLAVDNGSLVFKYSPANVLSRPTYEPSYNQQKQLSAGAIEINQWSHIAVTHQRNGNIAIYINGKKRIEEARVLSEHTLNNSLYLSLFADSYERSAINAAVDELKIWNYALSTTEVHQAMFSHTTANRNGLIYYNGFNSDILSANKESFTEKQPAVRTRAHVESIQMPISICAEYAVPASLSGRTLFAQDGVNLMAISAKNSSYSPELIVYGYTNDLLAEENTNLDKDYHVLAPISYFFKIFDSDVKDTLNIEFYAERIDPHKEYRLYTCDINLAPKYWQKYAKLKYNDTNGTLELQNVCVDDLADKQMVIATLKPSIEVSVPEVSPDGGLEIYTADNKQYTIEAQLTGKLNEPFNSYKIKSDNNFVQPMGQLQFIKGKAQAQFIVDTDSIGHFGDTKRVYLRGEDKRMIPFPINITNRMIPQTSGNSILIESGGFHIGTKETYSEANLSNTITMMGWVRIDSASVLSGLKPLLFFRGGGSATGIHLDNGNLRCHWNEESWSWGATTNLSLTRKDLGKWVHLALVVRPDGLDYYLDGAKYTRNRNMSKGRISSMLMLGQNNSNDKWFSGAFDQVAMWNRSLTQDEVIKYMHKSVALNDSALIVYSNMDYLDSKGNILEPKTGCRTTVIGKVTKGHRSPTPFNAASVLNVPNNENENSNAVLSLNFPKNKFVPYYINTFKYYPYNYATTIRATEVPLSKEFYTLIYNRKTSFTTPEDTITVDMNHPAILANDSLTLAIRPLGAESTFNSFVPATSTENGKVTFKVSEVLLSEASELMVMISPEAGKRPVKALLSSEQAVENQVILKDDESSIPVRVKMLSSNPDDIVLISVKETEYASVDRENIEMGKEEDIIHIRIDKSKLDKMKLNPLTVMLAGAEANPLNLEVSLEPKVVLRLKNGVDNHHVVATTPVFTLEVEAELIQGVLNEEVALSVVSDVNSVINTGNGTLLTDQVVTINKLEHSPSEHGKTEEGWNLIGNPFLTNINLTKKQNVEFDKQKVTKFIYQYNKMTDNYEVSDMTIYDKQQEIIPFQSYFIQTLSTDAQINITPAAKETTLSRRTLDYFNASERMHIRLQIQTDGKRSDRTDIILDGEAHNEFIVNEDAPKLWSMSTKANQLYSLAGTSATAVNTLPLVRNNMEIPINLIIGTTGKISFHLEQISGFNEDTQVILHDNKTGFNWILNTGSDYSFLADQTGDIKERFILKIKGVGGTGIKENIVYPVRVEDNLCTISNIQGNAQIEIYDVSGRIIVSKTIYGETYSTKLADGTYLVKIKENNKEYTTKIIVQ